MIDCSTVQTPLSPLWIRRTAAKFHNNIRYMFIFHQKHFFFNLVFFWGYGPLKQGHTASAMSYRSLLPSNKLTMPLISMIKRIIRKFSMSAWFKIVSKETCYILAYPTGEAYWEISISKSDRYIFYTATLSKAWLRTQYYVLL